MRWQQEQVRRIAVPLGLVLVWEAAVRLQLVHSAFVPRPSMVAINWFYWIAGGPEEVAPLYSATWLNHVLSSTERVMAGLLIATVVGIVLGILVGRFRAAEQLLDPTLQVLRPIPVSAWLPFAVVFFGIKNVSAIFLIFIGAIFPIYLNTYHGVRQVDRILIRASQMLGTKSHRILWRVILPAALPAIFTGLRLAAGLAWVLVIVSEMLAVKSGLGYVMWDAYFFMRMDMIIAAMFSVGLMGFLTDRVIIWIKDWFTGWTQGLTMEPVQ